MYKKFLLWLLSPVIKPILTILEEHSKHFIEEEELHEGIDSMKFIKKNCDVAVDVNHSTQSWAILSLHGKKHSYIKFIEFSDKDLFEIGRFLRNFESINVDATPSEKEYLTEMF